MNTESFDMALREQPVFSPSAFCPPCGAYQWPSSGQLKSCLPHDFVVWTELYYETDAICTV